MEWWQAESLFALQPVPAKSVVISRGQGEKLVTAGSGEQLVEQGFASSPAGGVIHLSDVLAAEAGTAESGRNGGLLWQIDQSAAAGVLLHLSEYSLESGMVGQPVAMRLPGPVLPSIAVCQDEDAECSWLFLLQARCHSSFTD